MFGVAAGLFRAALDVGEEFLGVGEAAAALGKAEFPEAAQAQLAVIRGLTALLEKLEETQGLIDSDREAALRMVREMLKKQQELREATKVSEMTAAQAEELTDKQSQLHKELGKVADALANFPTTEPLFEEAKQAAYDATSHLFQEQKPEALDEQQQVIGNLAQIEKVLEQGLDLEQSSKSADELAKDVQKLWDEQAAETFDALGAVAADLAGGRGRAARRRLDRLVRRREEALAL